MRRPVLLVLGVLGGAVLGTAAPAFADVDDVLAGLRQDRLYVSPQSGITPDPVAVRAALEDTRVPTYVAVVPQADVDAEELGIDGLALQVLEGLADPEAVLVVVSDGQELQAVDGGQAGVDASAVLDRVLTEHLDEPFGPQTLTAALVDLARAVDEQDLPPAAGEPRSLRRTVGPAGLVAVAALGGGGWLYVRAQRRVLTEEPLTREDLTAREPGWSGVPDR